MISKSTIFSGVKLAKEDKFPVVCVTANSYGRYVMIIDVDIVYAIIKKRLLLTLNI
jgi:hypothetical protein